MRKNDVISIKADTLIKKCMVRCIGYITGHRLYTFRLSSGRELNLLTKKYWHAYQRALDAEYALRKEQK